MKLLSLVTIVAALFLSINLSAEEESYYSSCYGVDTSPFSFESCVNGNFRTANRDFNTYVRSCYSPDRNPFSYESCVNGNFRTLSTKVSGYLSHCYGVDSSPFSFESCVNRNFRELQRASNNEWIEDEEY